MYMVNSITAMLDIFKSNISDITNRSQTGRHTTKLTPENRIHLDERLSGYKPCQVAEW